jgi:hypothetical protein
LLPAVFIRAPYVVSVGPEVDMLATVRHRGVAVEGSAGLGESAGEAESVGRRGRRGRESQWGSRPRWCARGVRWPRASIPS